MKVSVLSARPQFIKASLVSRVLRRTPSAPGVLLYTGSYDAESCTAW
jgi:UDP-N-acetylglucosamine 2-epimerase